jgi:hypothetical protein
MLGKTDISSPCGIFGQTLCTTASTSKAMPAMAANTATPAMARRIHMFKGISAAIGWPQWAAT